MKRGEGGGGAYNRTKKVGSIYVSGKPPLPRVNINTYFSLRAKCWQREG